MCRLTAAENEKEPDDPAFFISKLAEPTGFEPATSDVTGRRSNQLNYDSALEIQTCSTASRGPLSDTGV
jgi:hypothetical protein